MEDDKKAAMIISGQVPDVAVGYHEPHAASFWTKFVSHIWDSDQHLKSPQVCSLSNHPRAATHCALGTSLGAKARLWHPHMCDFRLG